MKKWVLKLRSVHCYRPHQQTHDNSFGEAVALFFPYPFHQFLCVSSLIWLSLTVPFPCGARVLPICIDSFQTHQTT